MAFSVVVDLQRCEGHGQCLIEEPGVFGMDDEGYAEVMKESVDDLLRTTVEQAVRACPAGAVSISE
ncbi:ferredoxin [Rhodococcus koreensis]|uniref:ferredoxin n=1 Tax=Rhodococcus koreensis TaxID=99653 RepID=UPI00366EB010